jgi:rod shape-determining protein MreC
MLIFSRYTYWVGAMLGLAFLLGIMGQTGLLGPFQSLFLKAVSPFENVLSGAFTPVASFLSDAGSINDLQDENARLRIENEDLRNQVTQLKEDAQQIDELRNALNIQQTSGTDTKVAASVVAHNALAFTDVVSINKGSGAGIKTGMVVLSAQGTLMGTVTTVKSDVSFVRLVTDSRSAVNAQVVESKADGTIHGTANRGLEFDLSQADIKVGDTVVTSGLGGNYPPGVPIGLVSAVTGSAQDLFRHVTVEPLVRLSTTTTVLVNISFTPQRIDLATP